MDILKELEHLELVQNPIGELQESSLPLVMWGAGDVAEEVNEYLSIHGVRLSDVFVDDEYYTDNMMFGGKKIISRTELCEKYSKVNVILGHSSYEKIRLLEGRKIINKVFYLFSVSYGVYDKTPLNLIRENIDEFELVSQQLEDELSRVNYFAFLKTRVTGNNQYILDIFKKEANYFNNDVFRIGEQEVFLDIGAYDGDTIRLFMKENGERYKRIYALEPDDINRSRLNRYITDTGLDNVFITEKGAWNKRGRLYFSSNNEQICGVVTEGIASGNAKSIIVEPLDTLFEYQDNVTMLKINYFEGVKEALQGAENILKTHKPKLAVTVGFDCRNIRSIPKLIKEMNPDYKLYLRYNHGMLSSLVLYGTV